jgi:hypothetical protein
MFIKNSLFVCFIVLFGCRAIPQTNYDVNELKQYSYLVLGLNNVRDSSGFMRFDDYPATCFFVRQNGKLFIVSAKHVFTSWDYDSNKRRIYPDTLSVRLYNPEGIVFQFIKFSIKQFNDSITGQANNDPDVFPIEFNDTGFFQINSIEKFIKPIQKNLIDSIYTFGYPANISLHGGENLKKFMNQSASLTYGVLSQDFDLPLTFNRAIEYTQYGFGRNNSDTKKGCSGSPVFIKLKGTNEFIFGGIFSRASNTPPLGFAVKPEYLAQKINTLLIRAR